MWSLKGQFADDALIQYTLKHSSESNPILKKLQKHTLENVRASIMLGSQEGLGFLANLARSINTKKAIDIGVYTGSSSLVIAQILPDDGKLVACDISEEFTNIAKPFWKEAAVDKKIDLRIAPATKTLESLLANGEEGTYDFAFIDADKGNYSNYYELCLKLIRKGGIIAVDNVLWGGRVVDKKYNDSDTEAIRALNEKMSKDKRVHTTMLYLGDGTSIAFKL